MTAPARAPIPIRPAVGADAEQTIWLYEKRAQIYPRAVQGGFAAWRWALVWATQLVFYGLPWLTWNDRPAMLFDLAARRFYIFGLVLHPQDFIYLAVLLVICAYALFLFTAVAGRLWCGFACPQTVYTEIFLWVERRIEGDRRVRMKRDGSARGLDWAWRKTAKHAVWLAIALWTGLTFVGYFTPIRVLAAEAQALSLGPWEAFWIGFYGLATYGNAGWLREQVCLYMCPYARFQSAMFDRDTLVVSYDPQRGEPRGSRPRRADRGALGVGDCIDCGLCVEVCPTGIDIRQGLQYACIGCAACVDVCNGVMDKMAYPRGLIRFATQRGLAERLGARHMARRVLRPRVLIYGAVLGVIAFAFVASLAWRSPLRVDVVRDRGALARQVAHGAIENVYRLQLMNVTEAQQRVRVTVEGIEGARVATPADLGLASAEARWLPVSVQIGPEVAAALGAGAHRVEFVVESEPAAGDAAAVVRERSTFVVPR
jgi:cytochrome c oxidase accessory protein FixG